MRTKVDRTGKKTGQQKVNINFTSPKVVLNANDCAKFLDSMGKNSILLVEKESRMLAGSSEVSSPEVVSATPASSVVISSESSLTSSTNVSPSIWAAATPTKICNNLTTNLSARSTSADNSLAHMEISSADIVQKDQDASSQRQTILKPPKKRRGVDKKFDSTNNPLVINNGDIVNPVISTPEEFSIISIAHRKTDSSSVSIPSPHKATFQKHSVEHLLQHQPGHPVNAIINQNIVTKSSSDSKSHTSSMNELNLLTNPSSVISASASSPTLEVYNKRPSFTPQIFSQHFSSSQPSHPYPVHTSSIDLLSLTQSHNLSFNKTVLHSDTFQELPEQIEPINLSTSCKPAVSLTSLQMLSTTDIQTLKDISRINLQHPLSSGMTEATESVKSSPISKSTKQKFEFENATELNKLIKQMPESASFIPCSDNLCSEIHPTSQLVQNLQSDSDDHDRAIIAVSKASDSPVDCDKISNTISNISTEIPISNAEFSLLPNGEVSQGTEKSTENQIEHIVSSELKSCTQSQPLISTTASPIHKTPEEIHTEDNHLVKNVTEVITDNAAATAKTVKKMKKAPKKKMEVPMDDAACLERMHKYSQTIEDVCGHFVYIPEPIEEVSLTEEEEAVIRDQFEKDNDSSSYKNTEAKKCLSAITNKAGLHNGYNTPSVDTDSLNMTETPQVTALEAGENPVQDVQKAVDNIDSVLEFVANDCSISPSDTNLNIVAKVKKAKKPRTVNHLEKVKQKKTKNNILCNKTSAENNNETTSELNCSSTEATVRKCLSTSNQENDTENTQNTCKPLKSKKRQSVAKATSKVDISLHTDQVAEVKVGLKRKSADGKVKSSKKKKTDAQQVIGSADCATGHSGLFLDKEGVEVSHVETSDIGESIASTSGSSEQDTPVHEQESKDEIIDANPQTADRESHDTGLESGGDELPVRRYKKRLDFVKCDHCDHQARGRSALSRHLKKVHMLDMNMPLKCQHCDYGCTKMASLNRHLFTHGIYSCSRCSFVTDERAKLTEHTIEQHKDKVDVKMCKVCNRYIKCNLTTIEQHSQECTGPTPFQCSECEKEFKYASSLRVHYHTHYPDQPKRFKCEQCDYRTNYKANLHKHHKNMHASRDRDVQCPECGKLFSTEDNMRRHRKVHTMVRPFACETCEKTFKTSGALKGHQLVHTATRPYMCNIPGCNRNFRTPKFLKSHQEEFHRLVPKKFFCSVEGCNYSFFKRSHLKRHAITHTGERNFHCTWPGCTKSFRHADNLKVHFRSHTNEKPVQCNLCDFKCKQKNSLFWHKKRVHQIIDISVCPSRLVHKNKPIVADDVQKAVSTICEIEITNDDVQTTTPAAENTSDTPVVDNPPILTKIIEPLPLENKTDCSPCLKSNENSEPSASPNVIEPITNTCAFSQEDQGPVDLYEFKSDDESEDKAPSTFRRDKNTMNVLTPLPPPPKELLRKNEILEMKEREKKEKADKKEQERQEKAERKLQEKNEKEEKKNIEKKAKAEKKELELKEKVKMKEHEKEERIKKKELEKKDKLERKELEKKEKIEKKQQEKKEKLEKKEQEKKEKAERKENDKKAKCEKKLIVKTEGLEDKKNCEDLKKSPVKSSPNSLKRRKSPSQASKEEPVQDIKICKRGRKKLQDVFTDKSKMVKIEKTPSQKTVDNEKIGTTSLRRKDAQLKKGGEQPEKSSNSSESSDSDLSKQVKSLPLKRTLIRRCKQKVKLSPPKRKPSARIKAKNKSKAVKAKTLKTKAIVANCIVKNHNSPKPGMKRKNVKKKIVSSSKEIKEEVTENVEVVSKISKTDVIGDIKDSVVTNVTVDEVSAPLNVGQEEIVPLPARATSPASSEEVMLQGKASPYRDFSDDENQEEQPKTPNSCLSPKPATHCSADEMEECEVPGELSLSEGNDDSTMEKHISLHPEDYSDDDSEVSNDIPLTPPRAPAPPPIESSEDEFESEPETTPFSVPGPTTPFSVPGPHTPFSLPPPTNLMQQHSVNSEETPTSAVPSVPSMEMQGSVDMQQSLESVEVHPHGSVEMNHSHGSVEMHHSQNSFEVPHSHSSMEIRPHTQVEISSHCSTEMAQSHGSVEMMCHRSITESISHSEQQAQSPESVMRDISNNHISEKYDLPQSLHEQTQLSESDKEYFDQYLKSLSAANNRTANGSLVPSPSGLQQLEAMVGKSHFDSKEISSKSPISCLPTSVITSLESTLPLLSHGDLRARLDAFVSDRHHESLYTRDTPSSLSRISDRQTPLSHSAMGHSPAFDAFSSLNSLHPASAGGGRENSYLRQPENLYPTPPGTNSFMAEAMFQRQAMTTPFLAPQPSDRSSLSRIPDASSLQSSTSSSLLRRSGTVPGSDMFSPPTMPQRHPFANAWASQEMRPAHWQTPYLTHQPNMTAAGTFFPSKDNYLTGREFMFDPSIRPSTDRSMFPSLSSSQNQDSFQLDRFDLSNYFPNAMTPYGSAPTSLEYSRSAHVAASKPFDNRYRQSATSASIQDFRPLPPSGSSDMFTGLPGVNSSFNLYAGNPMSYHTQHMADNVNSAFLTHPSSAQHTLFDRDYAAAAAHRSLYPQNTPYSFVDDRQYPGASKLAHAHSGASTVASQERNLVSRSAAPESQMQDPYRSLLYRY